MWHKKPETFEKLAICIELNVLIMTIE